jgi:hypothetical protein
MSQGLITRPLKISAESGSLSQGELPVFSPIDGLSHDLNLTEWLCQRAGKAIATASTNREGFRDKALDVYLAT